MKSKLLLYLFFFNLYYYVKLSLTTPYSKNKSTYKIL